MKILLCLCLFLVLSQGKDDVPYCSDTSKYNASEDRELYDSLDMPEQVVTHEVAIPLPILWKYIQLADFTHWNPLFNSVQTTNFYLCGDIDAVYSNGQFLGPILPPISSGPHYIIQMGCDNSGAECAFGWWFNLYDNDNNRIVYGRHTYTFSKASNANFTNVNSYEKAAGENVAKNSIPWTNALQESLLDGVIGMVCLERWYQSSGSLDPVDVANFCTHFLP